jgi:colanic acid/amylovoran biosynthesis glycosyltransferase
LKALALAHWSIEHSVDHIHAYWLSAPATVAMTAAQIAGIPWSATAHRWDIYERNAIDVKSRTATFVRTISARGTRDLSALSPQLRGRVVQVPIGTIGPQEPAWQAREDPTLRLVCPAALVAVKGHDDLLRALALLRAHGVSLQCIIAGEGPLRETLEERAQALGLEDAVTFPGFIPQERLHDMYCNGEVGAVVLASRQDAREMEGIPSALVEAMAFGVPVVTTSSGSIGELVDEHCGHVVPPGDPAALANALMDVYRRPFVALARAASAYARVAARHDVRRQMEILSSKINGGVLS